MIKSMKDTPEKLLSLSMILATLKKCGLSISRNTMYRWIKSGYFPPRDYRVGASGRWKESTFKAWLRSCVQAAQSA